MMNCYDNIECFKCVNTCDVLTFGLAPETGSYTFTIIYNDNERLFNLTFNEGETIELPAYELNENGTSIIVVTFGETIIAACKIKVSIGYIGNQSSDDIDVGGCPTLCQRIEVAQWSEIKACMNDEQIDAAIEDLCDIECEPVTYTITRDNLPFANGSVPSGGNLNFNVPSDCPPPTECDPLEITFGGYPLITVPEPCGETVALSCDSLTIHAYVDDGAEVTGVYYKDGSNYVRDEDHFIFYNGTAWEIEKTGGNITAANGSEEFPWQADWSGHPSVTVTQATIGQQCGGGVCEDVTISLNGSNFLTVTSGGSEDISLIDENGVDIIPTDVTGSTIEVYTGGDTRLPKTGADTATIAGDDGTSQRGKGTSFFLLDTNNPFGHLRRFTGKTGGYHDGTNYKDVNGTNTTEALAFPDAVMLDWMDRTEIDVKAYRYTFYVDTPNNAVPAQPITHDSHNDWYLANFNEVVNLGRKNQTIGGWFTWLPINHTITTTVSTRILTSTPDGSNNYFVFAVSIGITNRTSTANWFLTRRYTLASLGL